MEDKNITVSIELTEEEAAVLSKFCSWLDFDDCIDVLGLDNEADQICEIADRLQDAIETALSI